MCNFSFDPETIGCSVRPQIDDNAAAGTRTPSCGDGWRPLWRPNGSSDRLALKRLELKRFKGYRWALSWMKSDGKWASYRRFTENPLIQFAFVWGRKFEYFFGLVSDVTTIPLFPWHGGFTFPVGRLLDLTDFAIGFHPAVNIHSGLFRPPDYPLLRTLTSSTLKAEAIEIVSLKLNLQVPPVGLLVTWAPVGPIVERQVLIGSIHFIHFRVLAFRAKIRDLQDSATYAEFSAPAGTVCPESDLGAKSFDPPNSASAELPDKLGFSLRICGYFDRVGYSLVDPPAGENGWSHKQIRSGRNSGRAWNRRQTPIRARRNFTHDDAKMCRFSGAVSGAIQRPEYRQIDFDRNLFRQWKWNVAITDGSEFDFENDPALTLLPFQAADSLKFRHICIQTTAASRRNVWIFFVFKKRDSRDVRD